MAAPTFVGAGAGVTIASGSAAVTAAGSGVAVGDLVILQVLQDGTAASAVTYGSISGITALNGTANSLTTIATDQAVGNPTAAKQHLRAGRASSTTCTVTVTTTGDDLYYRIYVFRSVLAVGVQAHENSTIGSIANGAGTGTTVSDTGVTTLGVDRLALQFVGINDDSAIDAFAGMTGGTWAEAIAEYATATGTDAAIQLQTATMATAGTIDGGSDAIVTAGWGVIGFALKPLLALNQEGFRFRNDDGNETAATWRQAVNTADTIALDTNFRVRFAVAKVSGDNTNDQTYQLQYRRKPSGGAFGAWANIDGTTSVGARWAASPHFASIVAATQQISAGAFEEGRLLENSATANLGSGHTPETKTELEFTLSALSSAGAADGDIYEFRVTLSTSGTPFSTYTQTPSLTVGAGGTAHTATPADTLSLADAVASTAAFARTLTDPLAIADAVAFQRDVTLPLADTLSLADSIAAQRGIAQAVADTLTLADLATTAAGKGVSLDDTLALADAVTSQAAFVRGLADTLSLADTLAAQSAFQLSVTDTLALADALASQAVFARAVADTLTLADLADPVKGAGGVDHTQPIADVVALADALTAGSTLARSIADTIALADSLTAQKAILRDLADTLSLADTLRFGRALGLTDTLALADAVSFQAVYLRTLADTVGLTDAVTAGLQLTRAIADTVALLDSLAATLGRAVLLEDTVALTDLLDALLTAAVGAPPRASGRIDFPGQGVITRPTRGSREGAGRGRIDTSTVGVLTKPRRGTT